MVDNTRRDYKLRFLRSRCRRSSGAPLESPNELVRAGNPAKQRLDHEKRRLMIASRGIVTDIPDRLGHAVFEEQAGIISEHRVPYSRFHAHAGSASGNHEIAGIQCLEDVIQSGLIKAAEPSLVKDNVPRLRLEPIYNLRVPGISNQNPAFGSIRSANCVSISQARRLPGLENP